MVGATIRQMYQNACMMTMIVVSLARNSCPMLISFAKTALVTLKASWRKDENQVIETEANHKNNL